MNNVDVKLIGVHLIVSFPFLVVMCLMLILDLNSIYALTSFALHELTHIVMIFVCGGKLNSIKFSLCEIDINTEKDYLSKGKKILISVSGAMTNFVIALTSNSAEFSAVNMIVGSFQLLPILSFDGDSILEILGLSFKLRKTLSLICSFLIALVGFYVLIQTKNNFSALILSMFLIFLSLKSE